VTVTVLVSVCCVQKAAKYNNLAPPMLVLYYSFSKDERETVRISC